MSKSEIKFICVVMAIAVFISTFTACSIGGNGGGGTTEPQEIVVDNTGANTVSPYDTNGAYSLSIDAGDEIHDISDLLFGAFFEDINFAADGGLYAEMIVNRSFEYNHIAQDDELYRWTAVNGAKLKVDYLPNHSLNENNPHYLIIKNETDAKAGVENHGFLDGMSIEDGESYNVSFYAKSKKGYEGNFYVNLAVDGNVVASSTIPATSNDWTKYTATLTSSVTAHSKVTLQVLIDSGEAYFDMISLFPENTYKNRENGLRADMCQLLEELQPKFLRFPGGCITEGYDDASAYDWKDSIGTGKNGLPLKFNGKFGDVATRKQGVNLWTNIELTDDQLPCYMSYGLGFFEYFQLAEDIGAIGVPVLNAGLYCQARGKGPISMDSAQFKQYVQDMHDLIEFCRGDENTTWGKVRIDLGRDEPFKLKYICIGNENWGQGYFERYSYFLNSFNEAKEKNPELYEGIELIYSSGVDDGISGQDYLASYEYAKAELDKIGSTDASDFAAATDHHYYNDPSWFYENADYYDEDNYKRDVADMTDTIYGGGLKVFVGEYASWSNTLNSALSEAAYMTGLERNGDIVEMAAYAPLFGNLTATHWAPDLIWFNNHQVTGSINYYVQKLFSRNQGSAVLNHTFTGAGNEEKIISGAVGVGTWYTSAKFDNLIVTDNKTGEKLAHEKFSTAFAKSDWNFATDGKWKIKKGALVNTTTAMNYSNTGSVAYFGDTNWNNYTMTVQATKLDGGEGFIIPFAVKDIDNNIFWNIGGWENTVSCLQKIENGNKSDKIVGTVKDITIETGRTYEIKVVVDGAKVKGYIDGELYVDYDFGVKASSKAYTVVSNDDNGDIIIKLVNVTEKASPVAVNIANANVDGTAIINQVAGDSLKNDNILGAVEDCIMKEFTLDGFSNQFNYTMPAYSVTSIRLKTK
ncbi:MAG: carbohydrate binding domain-containing protein [Clostridia bacterium]|nr:carbohydrate binding domain-containing protein [Clostridia bacterium]